MEASVRMGSVTRNTIKEKLEAIAEPQNAILARLQNSFLSDKSKKVVCGYSRMHNRHNRS